MQAGRPGPPTLLTLGLVAGFTVSAGSQLREPALRVALRTDQAVTSGSTLLAGDTFAIVRVNATEPRTLVTLPADDAVREFRQAFTAGAAPVVSATVEITLPASVSESESEAASVLEDASLEVVLFQDLDGNRIWSQDEPFVSAWHGGRGSYRPVYLGAPDASRPGAQRGWNLEEGGVPPVYHTDFAAITVFIDPVIRAIERPGPLPATPSGTETSGQRRDDPLRDAILIDMPSPRSVAAFGAAVVVVVVAVSLLVVSREANRRGQPVGDLLRAMFAGSQNEEPPPPAAPSEGRRFLEPRPIGSPLGDSQPWVTHVSVVDLDQDGLPDVIVCDATANAVSWIRQAPAGVFTETVLGDTIPAPAHVTPSDVDGDGDLDLLVAQMGVLLPNNDPIGAVVLLENDGQQRFTNRVLLDTVARVTDIEPGDFDGDGDVDLAVGQFGYDDGEIRWMENLGGWQFESHNLLTIAGTIHAPVGDLDGDGDLDIAAVVSQEWEEIYVFENDGAGGFDRHLVYGATNDDFGSSGIALVDLDGDDDLDVLYTNGDAFDYMQPGPRPWHGVQWLENRGGLNFVYNRIGDFPGAYFATAVDGDGDGDLDVFLVSAFNDWDSPDATSMAWFENDGDLQFTLRPLATAPTHLLTLASGDLDGDGWVDFVTGGMHVYPPYDRMSRVTLWRNRWAAP